MTSPYQPADDPIFRLPPLRIEAAYVALAETIDWGLAAYNVPEHWKNTKGAGIRVAVLDTGIDEEHVDLAAAIENARDFTDSPIGPTDRHGHGTHVAGTIAARANDQGVIGVAPEARLLIAKVLGDDGSGTSRAVAHGIDWAIEAGADILSLSLGSPSPSAELRAAIERAVAAGKFVLCAAGNEGRADAINYPARWETTIAVGAVDRQGKVARFSSRGPQLDIAAPGEDITSTFPGGYAKLSGTSMATPFVAGIVALLLAKHRQQGGATPVRTNAELREHLGRTATDAGPHGQDPTYGFGLINPDKLLTIELPATPGITIFIPNAQLIS